MVDGKMALSILVALSRRLGASMGKTSEVWDRAYFWAKTSEVSDVDEKMGLSILVALSRRLGVYMGKTSEVWGEGHDD